MKSLEVNLDDGIDCVGAAGAEAEGGQKGEACRQLIVGHFCTNKVCQASKLKACNVHQASRWRSHEQGLGRENEE